MEFTKEEIKTAEKIWDEYSNKENVQETVSGFRFYLHSLLKPERKKIRVEIEYDVTDKVEINLKGIYYAFKNSFSDYRDIKVTELPEVFSREDMILFANYYYCDHTSTDQEQCLIDWLSERSSK
jgi:hypothetical protein